MNELKTSGKTPSEPELPPFNDFSRAAQKVTKKTRFDFSVFDEEDLAMETYMKCKELVGRDQNLFVNLDPSKKSAFLISVARNTFRNMYKKHLRNQPKRDENGQIEAVVFGRTLPLLPHYELLLMQLTEAEKRLFDRFAEQGEFNYERAEAECNLSRKTLYNQWNSIVTKARRIVTSSMQQLYSTLYQDPYSAKWIELIDLGPTIPEKNDLRIDLLAIWTSWNVKRYFDDESPCPDLVSRCQSQIDLVRTSELSRNLSQFRFTERLNAAFVANDEKQLRSALQEMPSSSGDFSVRVNLYDGHHNMT